jgi:hypothetical protein
MKEFKAEVNRQFGYSMYLLNKYEDIPKSDVFGGVSMLLTFFKNSKKWLDGWK